MSLIPEIPFSSIINNNDKSIDILKKALTSHGFFSITGHSLSNDLVDHCYKSSQEFFKLNIETKLQYHDKKLKGARGYTPNGIETSLGENIPDQKEFWHHGPIVDDSFDQRVSKNLFINELEDFNKNYEAPKEWLSDYEARKNEYDLSLRDAQEINKQVVKRTTTTSPFTAGRRSIPNYGNGPQTWLPSRPRPSSVFNDTEDEWYSNYKKLQTKKDYY